MKYLAIQRGEVVLLTCNVAVTGTLRGSYLAACYPFLEHTTPIYTP